MPYPWNLSYPDLIYAGIFPAETRDSDHRVRAKARTLVVSRWHPLSVHDVTTEPEVRINYANDRYETAYCS